PVGPLQLTDELNMELFGKIERAYAAAAERDGTPYVSHPGVAVVHRMIELGRPSRLKGAGFYDYDDAGKRTRLWPGLAEEFLAAEPLPLVDIQERMLFAEALETAKCFEEGVISSAAAANIGSIMGIGFPPNTGGAAQFMTGYVGADGSVGLAAFLARADELAEAYGDRFRPTAWLREMAAAGETFPA
ncbi:MAG: 3-hydroxyacyl-CoA dehydrogenase, partial [Nocardioidaceae bacterium]|nr:3-hydroxyacyl-CoA dehydrogenase [Nocardioidaceae bacterium]